MVNNEGDTIAKSDADVEIQGLYDQWHDRAGQVYDAQSDLHAPWHEAALPYLKQSVPGHDVLEIGCGRGAMARYLVDLGARTVTAADFSRSAVRQAQDILAGTAARATIEDIQRMSYSSASFDTVVSFETIEHCPDPERAIAELARVLRPGGTLILTTPNYLGLMGLFRIYKRLTGHPFTEAGQPINKLVMLPRTIRWIDRAGLKVDHWFSRGQYLPWPGQPIQMQALDRLGPVSRITGLHSLVVAHKD